MPRCAQQYHFATIQTAHETRITDDVTELRLAGYPRQNRARINCAESHAWPSGFVDGPVASLSDASAAQIVVGKCWTAVTMSSGSVLQLPLTEEGGVLNGTSTPVRLPSDADDSFLSDQRAVLGEPRSGKYLVHGQLPRARDFHLLQRRSGWSVLTNRSPCRARRRLLHWFGV
jgi:hypothetical protein